MSQNRNKSDKIVETNSEQATVSQKNSGSAAMTKTISSYLPAKPVPLKMPTIDNDFNNLSTVERVAESLKYNLLCIEYSISPKGGLRQRIKINLSLFLLFGIPILVFVPLATYLMGGFANISKLLADATQFLLVSAQNILKLIAVIIAIVTILYIIFKVLPRCFSGKEKDDEKGAGNEVGGILKNGPGSTKVELQEWWDKYH